MRFILFLLLSLLVTTASARNINPKKLEVVESGRLYELEEPYVFKSTYYATRIEHVLMPGTYVEGFRGKDGRYLVGGDGSLEIRVMWTGKEGEGTNTRYTEGGVFLPNDPAKLPTMFYVQHADSRVVMTLNGEVTRIWERGREVTPVQSDPQIAKTVVPGASPVAAAAGTAIAYGLINALIRAGEGKFMVPKKHKGDPELRVLLVPEEEFLTR